MSGKNEKTKKVKEKKKSSKALTIILILLMLIFLGGFGFASYKLITINSGYVESKRDYEELSDQFVSAAPEKTEEQAEEEKEIERSPINVDFANLLQQSADVKGWIYQPDTNINYPIAQCGNNDFYLHAKLNGEYSANGTPFIDFLCAGDFTSKNTIIHGHHMNDGSMFASIVYYKDQAYYDAHPVVYINTPNGNYKLQLFAGYITDAASAVYRIDDFVDESDYLSYLLTAKSQSNFECEYTPTVEDRIVTMSTCTYEFENARYVLQGILVPIG